MRLILALLLMATTVQAEPVQFQLYCLAHPRECPSVGPTVAKWSPIIASVDRQVNSSIKYKSERGDQWSSDVSVGDCDDYVMTKRRRLIQAGFPPRALIPVVVKHGTHLVLHVRTDRGTVVLDIKGVKYQPAN